jgi:NAD(P)H-nitrite reductase large subunit
MSRIVIIGASIAGHTAAVNLREKNGDCQVTLVTEENYPLYDKRRLLDLLAGNAKEKDVFLAGENFYKERNISFIKERKASLINTEKKTVSFKDRPAKEALEYDFLVICSGRRPVLPEIPGIRKEGVFKFYSLGDVKEFSGRLNLADEVCLVGSNEFAFKIAGVIASRQKEVKLISPGAPGSACAQEGVEVINSEVTEIIGESEVLGIRLKEGKIIGTSLVCFIEEFKSNTEFLKNSGIEVKSDFIPVDASMRTNLENVFASGAVCSGRDSAGKMKSWDEAMNESLRLVDNLVKVI